jgi:hypothetical protein
MLSNFVPWFKNLDYILNIIMLELLIDINILCINMCLKNKQNNLKPNSNRITFLRDLYE